MPLWVLEGPYSPRFLPSRWSDMLSEAVCLAVRDVVEGLDSGSVGKDLVVDKSLVDMPSADRGLGTAGWNAGMVDLVWV